MGAEAGRVVGHAEALDACSPDYATARARLIAEAAGRGWIIESQPIDGAGPAGEPLTIDVALSPSGRRDRALIVSSGLHGVEGPFGSAVQVAALPHLAALHESGMRVVLIHALNPYGFAWGRRVDAANVDLNRAFRWDGMPESRPSDDYATLDALLNPPRPPARVDTFAPRVIWAAIRSGPATLRRVIASGQRTHPKGLFFAGRSISALQRALDAHLPRWIDGAPVVCHLDLHTGLGRHDAHQLIVDYDMPAATRVWMHTTFAGSAIIEPSRDASAYTSIGSLGQWCVARGFAPDYRFAFAEFGTYGNLSILAALRAENQARHWLPRGDPAEVRAVDRLRACFCPPAPAWRARAVADGVALVSRAARGLGEDRAARPTMPHGPRVGE